ncbi:TetR/AcrR family transcriptional regulator [Capillimicrobium parvum]|uniref:HTH-type transcriptional regulator BetI n=1 Tax=Capillimicrobium parvum TaxID=2884022 RepID=A0A9E7C058_9ACTN|nr:TetR/AcrR family transcriptional regulator [Capillimicrobium parvum]UGS36031.1 HTH-type transcriptional regulator BetI [Capillimicrobium parvum]
MTTAGATRPSYGEGRQALLDAAIRVVAASGLRGLTIRAVGAEAGVTHGLVRHHFGSREALIEETLKYSAQVSIAASSLDPEDGDIDGLAANLPAMAEQQGELQAFQFELLLEARRRPELLPHVRAIYDEYLEATADGLRRAGVDHDADLALLVMAALDGLVLQQVVFGQPERTERVIGRLHDVLRAVGGGGGRRPG